MKKISNIILVMATLWVAMSFTIHPTDQGKLKIEFKNYVGKELLKPDSAVYKNELGQSFTVTNFKYYISNIRLKKADGKEYVSPDYFLINEDDAASRQLFLNAVPAGNYTSISFIIGVDSLHNCSGAQSGALDPANGMFWAWNSGYIFLKLEGKAPESKSPGHIFEYHIGGYKQPVNCIRKVTLNLDKQLSVGEKISVVNIRADASELLKTPVTIDFSKLSSVTDFHNAATIADNYKDMFSILNVQNEK